MLHALLHRKLDESIPEPQRLEDALTSTVFGTLVWVGAWETLARWLGVSFVRPPGGKAGTECWFWPRLARAEPDVVLRLNDTLVVVEAKYRSGRHDRIASDEIEDDPCDQLVRQYQSIKDSEHSRASYPEPLERAIRECQLVQAFVVDASRRRRAQREHRESEALLPTGASLRLVTWQSLFALLGDSQLAPARWSVDLKQYLELVGLHTFEGMGRRVGDYEGMRRILSWRARTATSQFRQAVPNAKTSSVVRLRHWKPSGRSQTGTLRLAAIDQRIINGSAPRAVLAWRPISTGLDATASLPRRE